MASIDIETLFNRPGDYPNATQFTTVAPHYDALMRGVPYRRWAQYLHQILDRRKLTPRRILDLACGTGNVAEILAGEGYEVVGADISAPMIEQAQKKAAKRGLKIEYVVQDAAELTLEGGPFDLCVSLFDSLNYVLDLGQLERALHRVFAHLRPGGLLIFDINSAYALENNFFDQDNLNTDDKLRYIWRSVYYPETRLCRVFMRFFLRHRDGVDREFRETHVQFAYTEEELRAMLSRVGFRNVDTHQAYTFRPSLQNSDRIFFLAERP